MSGIYNEHHYQLGHFEKPVEIPLATENRLENTDGVLHHCSLGAVACCPLLLLTCGLLVTSSYSEGLLSTTRTCDQHTTCGSGKYSNLGPYEYEYEYEYDNHMLTLSRRHMSTLATACLDRYDYGVVLCCGDTRSLVDIYLC